MNDICFEKVVENAGKHQMLIFVHSRKETVKTAQYLKTQAMENDIVAKFLSTNSASKEILAEEATQQNLTQELKELLPYGFAVHHAGLRKEDRLLVENFSPAAVSCHVVSSFRVFLDLYLGVYSLIRNFCCCGAHSSNSSCLLCGFFGQFSQSAF